MKRFAIMALALTATVLLAAAAQARGPGGIHHTGSMGVVSHHDFGHVSHHDFDHRRVSAGTFYRGIHHHHWSYTYWDHRYGCYLYWDPYAYCYYYWCAPAGCYYPVSYCPYNTYCWQRPVGGVLPAPVASVPVKNDVVVKVTNNNVNNNIQGPAPTPAGNVNVPGPSPTPTPAGDGQLPADVPPPISQGGPMVPLK
jgi:hypothetical protein